MELFNEGNGKFIFLFENFNGENGKFISLFWEFTPMHKGPGFSFIIVSLMSIYVNCEGIVGIFLYKIIFLKY